MNNTEHKQAGEAAHTPGPFELNEPDRKGVIYIDAPDGTSVASVETRALRNAPEARANAAFIVRACNSHAQLTAENAEWSRQYKEAITKRDELAVVADSLTAENAALREFAKQVVESMPTAEPWGPVDSSGWGLNEQEARLWKAARALLSGPPAQSAAPQDPVKAALVEALEAAEERIIELSKWAGVPSEGQTLDEIHAALNAAKPEASK